MVAIETHRRAGLAAEILLAFDFSARATTETASPDVGVEQGEKPQIGESLLRPWSVILHNDDHNDMVYVVRSLIKCVPNLGARRATHIMFEAHNQGKAVVTTCPLELAELYRERLQTCGLTATIEKA